MQIYFRKAGIDIAPSVNYAVDCYLCEYSDLEVDRAAQQVEIAHTVA